MLLISEMHMGNTFEKFWKEVLQYAIIYPKNLQLILL